MKSEFEVALSEIVEARALPRDMVLDALAQALVSAYKREAGIGINQKVTAFIDPVSWREKIFVEKEVVDEVFSDSTEVDLETARYYEPETQIGETAMVQLEGKTAKRFGRIAAQNAKQVILQKIREAERNNLFDEYSAREGEIVVGTVQTMNANTVTMSLGRAEAILPRAQQIPGERYKNHEKVRVYIMEVKKTPRGPQIVVSRSHRNMLRRLLEYEVPEIYNGQVEIKNIAREAGYRSKVAVAALQDGVDPVGACVGMRGMRIQNIVKELHEERIDVIEWSPKQEEFITEALRPAPVTKVFLEDDLESGRTAIVIVPDEELSNAIGRQGGNARLAAKLTGWRIDIKSVSEVVQDAIDNLDSAPLRDIKTQYADMLVDVERIMDKKANNRTIQPEDVRLMGKFAEIAQGRIVAAREVLRQKRMGEINAVKATLPQRAFEMPIEMLDVSDEIKESIAPLVNVGEVMWRFLMDEGRLRAMLANNPPQSLAQLQDALDRLVIPEMEAEVETPEAAVAALDTAPVPMVETRDDDSRVRDAIKEDRMDAGDGLPDIKLVPSAQPGRIFSPVDEGAVAYVEDDADVLDDKKGTAKGKKKKGTTLVFDEKKGSVVRKKVHKGNRSGWNEWDEDE